MKNVRRPTQKYLIIALAILVLAVGGLLGVWLFNKKNDGSSSETVAKTGINYEPPTDTEKQETQSHKDDIANQDNTPTQPPPSDTLKAVTPIIVTASYSSDSRQVTVSGSVPGVFEDGGTCKVTLTRGAFVVTKENQGFANVSRTDCPPIIIPRSEFASAGEWQAVLEYHSSSAQGTSASKDLTIP